VMCPSYKATLDRRHSPKGRAGLIREWLRQDGPNGHADMEFEAEVKHAMDGCLSCRACTNACPVQVDVPTFRAKFLEAWHRRHRRPMRDYVLANLEQILPLMAKMPALSNLMLGKMGAPVLRLLGLVHLPLMAKPSRGTPAKRLRRGDILDPAQDVIIVPDAFTRHFEPDLASDLAAVIAALGFTPWLAAYHPSGKPRQVLGMLKSYRRQSQRHATALAEFAAQGVALIGLEPATALAFDGFETEPSARILLPQEWLVDHLPRIPQKAETKQAVLLGHCTETTAQPKARDQWRRVFAAAGTRLQTPDIGCCGMAGTWGHLRENQTVSAKIFSQSWGPMLQRTPEVTEMPVLATGFSCRCQAKLHANRDLHHPIQLLRQQICPLAVI